MSGIRFWNVFRVLVLNWEAKGCSWDKTWVKENVSLGVWGASDSTMSAWYTHDWDRNTAAISSDVLRL